MSKFRSKLQNSSATVVFLFLTVSWGVGSWVAGILTGTSSSTPVSLIIRAIGAVIFGAIMTAWFMRQRRKAGGVVMATAIARSLKTGLLPADATADAWLPPLRHRERSLRLARWLNPVGFGFLAALGVALVLSNSEPVLVGWLFIALFVGVGIFSIAANRRELPKVRLLITKLTEGSPASAHPASGPTD